MGDISYLDLLRGKAVTMVIYNTSTVTPINNEKK